MLKNIEAFIGKPELYSPGTNSIFWTDKHISKHLLNAYLDQSTDASSRNLEFIDKSVKWIAETIPPSRYPRLLDLGCGAGLYAERFSGLGYAVTGIDFSERAVDYAKKQASLTKSSTEYLLGDYLTIDFYEEFDVITLIYCDFGALSDKDRSTLLSKIYRALKPGGKFILDVFTLNVYSGKNEAKAWEYYPNGGFWSAQSHLCLETNYLYGEDNTELRQCVVMTDNDVHCYNVWEHYFGKDSFLSEIGAAGFRNPSLYDDIAGSPISGSSETLCGIFAK